MNYFTKWIPTEDEFKKGAIVRLKPSGILARIGSTESFDGFTFMEHLQGGDSLSDEWEYGNLFLLSIEGGINVDIDQQQWQEMSRTEKNNYLFQTGQCKLVGEISSKALAYVGPDQEINEADIQLSKHPECPKCGAWDNDGFCPEEVDCQILKKRTVAYIKCSNCKIFH